MATSEEIEQQLALVVEQTAEASADAVLAAIRTLDAAADGTETDPSLRHFLKQRSYAKALAHLRNGEIERGTCGRGS